MKLSQQVCTIEQAKHLQKLGINQRYPSSGYYMWFGNGDRNYVGENNGVNCIATAFTSSELLVMNGELITLNELQLPHSAFHLADHLIGRLDRGELTVEEVNTHLYLAN